jgi:hypothetical protein
MQPTQELLDRMQDKLWAMSDDEFFEWMNEWSPETEAELAAGLALTDALNLSPAGYSSTRSSLTT